MGTASFAPIQSVPAQAVTQNRTVLSNGLYHKYPVKAQPESQNSQLFVFLALHRPILNRKGGFVMEKKQGRGLLIYLLALGAAALLCLAAGIAWMARGRAQAQEPRYLLKDHAGHIALYAGD